MPEPTKIPRPFADSGDKNTIPESSGALGFASWQEGFPAITGTPFAQGGVAPKRADFNGIFNALSLATLWQQQGGFYAYDNTTDYEVGNVVEYNNDLYKCITANGPSSAVKAPTETTVWSKVMTAADAAALYLPLSGGTLTGNLTLSQVLAFSSSSPVVNAGGADRYLRLGNGDSSTLYTNGASLYLYGASTTGESQGGFNLQSYDGVNRSTLSGRPDGTLTWVGNKVMTAADVTFAVVSSSTVSVAANTDTNITSYKFTGTGIYAAVYALAFRASGTSGVRQLAVSATSGGSNIDDSAVYVTNPPSAGFCFIQLPRLEKITTANTTRYLVAKQTTSSSMNVTGTIQVVRVGDA